MVLTIKEKGSMNIWFSSDYHFGHENIIKYCSRPFQTAEEMNDCIISNHNDIVRPDDLIYFLGDFTFRNSSEYLRRMNGHFIFIRGNHDPKEIRKKAWKHTILEYDKRKYLCVHRPKDIYGTFDLNIVGHVHEKWLYQSEMNAFNVGVDVHDFKPISLENIINKVDQIKGEIKNVCETPGWE